MDVFLEASQMDRKHFVPLAIVEWSVYIVDVRLESILGGLVNELLLICGGHDNNTVLGSQLAQFGLDLCSSLVTRSISASAYCISLVGHEYAWAVLSDPGNEFIHHLLSVSTRTLSA